MSERAGGLHPNAVGLVHFGADRVSLSFTGFNGGDPWTGFADDVWGVGFVIVIIALAGSALAGSNASSVASTRVGFALGRIGQHRDEFRIPLHLVIPLTAALAFAPVLVADPDLAPTAPG